MRKLPKYFFQGCLVLAPIAATLYILLIVFRNVDSIIPVGIPGLGFAITLGVVTLVGFLASNVVGKSVVGAAERLFTKTPLVKLVYGSIKDLIGAFVGEKKSFDKPVAVTVMPGSGVRVLGFVTREALGLGPDDHVAVYLPQSYNFAGFLLLVPRAQIEPLGITGSELMTFIVSGGLSGALTAPSERSE